MPESENQVPPTALSGMRFRFCLLSAYPRIKLRRVVLSVGSYCLSGRVSRETSRERESERAREQSEIESERA